MFKIGNTMAMYGFVFKKKKRKKIYYIIGN